MIVHTSGGMRLRNTAHSSSRCGSGGTPSLPGGSPALPGASSCARDVLAMRATCRG